MEDAYVIKGGSKIRGKLVLSGAKNIALKTIIAALLFKGQVILENIPRIKDVYELLQVIKSLGGKAEFIEKNTVLIDGSLINDNRVDLLYGSKIRVSFMFFAPLLYRFKTCYVPNPGGCRIGARPIDRIIEGMRCLNIEVNYNHKTGYYEAKMADKPKGSYFFNKSSHTGTEILILLSVFCRDKIIIKNAAFEPEIDELIDFLNQSGANIKREKNKIIIKGVTKLIQKNPFKIISDRNEAVTFSILAIASKGEVIINNIRPDYLNSYLKKVIEAGGGIDYLKKGTIRFYYKGNLNPVNIETSPHPGFMTDWQPNWAVLMSQAQGESIIHERVFENRFSYVTELQKLGANIEFINPFVPDPGKFYFFNYDKRKKYQQAIKIFGKQHFHNGVLTIADLRAGATLAIAALLAKGKSIVIGASILERGYENFDEKVRILGGEINKV